MPANKLLDEAERQAVAAAVRRLLAEKDPLGKRMWSQARLGGLFGISQESVRRAADPNGVGPAVRDGIYKLAKVETAEQLMRWVQRDDRPVQMRFDGSSERVGPAPPSLERTARYPEAKEAVAALVADGWQERRAKEVVGGILLDEPEERPRTALDLYRMAKQIRADEEAAARGQLPLGAQQTPDDF